MGPNEKSDDESETSETSEGMNNGTVNEHMEWTPLSEDNGPMGESNTDR